MPYSLSEKELLKLGFNKEEHYYIKDDIVISKIAFPMVNQTEKIWNDWGYCIIEFPQTEGDVKEGEFYINQNYQLDYKGSEMPPLERINKLKKHTTPVQYVHILQNYWRKKTGSELNVDMLNFD